MMIDYLKSKWEECERSIFRTQLAHKVAKQIGNAPKNSNIFFGDFNHADSNIHRLMSEIAILKALKRKGINDLFIEIPTNPTLQQHAQALTCGHISKERFLRFLATHVEFPHSYNYHELKGRCEAVADTVINASRVGMRVHFCDTSTNPEGVKEIDIIRASTAPSNDVATEKFAEFHSTHREVVSNRITAKLGVNWLHTMQRLPFNKILKMNIHIKDIENLTGRELTQDWTREDWDNFNKIGSQSMEAARGDDRARVNFIRSTISQLSDGEEAKKLPIALMFGGLHMLPSNPNSFVSQFENVWVCGIFSSIDHIKHLLQSTYLLQGEAVRSMQEAIVIKEGQTLSGDSLTGILESKTDSPKVPAAQTCQPTGRAP